MRFYIPPYAEFVQGSYKTTDILYPSAVTTYNSQNNQKELVLKVSTNQCNKCFLKFWFAFIWKIYVVLVMSNID